MDAQFIGRRRRKLKGNSGNRGTKRPKRKLRPERHARRRKKIECRRAARRAGRGRRVGAPRSVLRKLLGPLKTAVDGAISDDKEKSWFPALSMLAQIVCGVFYHLHGLASMRATVEKINHSQDLAFEKVSLSTFSDAMNSRRRLKVLRKVFDNLLLQFRDDLPRKFQRFRHVAAIDSTIIHCVHTAIWADFRKAVNACKAHVVFDLAKGIPSAFVLSAAKIHDRNYFEVFLKPGWTYVVDRAYNDYALFDDMIEVGIFFVTRLKSNAGYRVVKNNAVKRRHRKAGVVSDQRIRLGTAATEMENDLRLITFRTEEGDLLHFLTNRFDLAATSIAALYRARWAIELFFKFFKRTLRGVRLLSRSETGAEIHVLLTLIADLLLKCLAHAVGCWDKVKRHVPVTFLRAVRDHLHLRWSQKLEKLIMLAFT